MHHAGTFATAPPRAALAFARWVVAISAAAALSGCGGGGDDAGSGEPVSGAPVVGATASGTPLGAAVTKLIGPAGGQLATADGGLTVEVPPGAFGKDETLAIQEISNEVHGAPGRAWRITPEGLTSKVPMTLRFRYSAAELQGTGAQALQVGYQDAQRRWSIYASPTRDTAGQTLSVRTTHFSDWARFASAWLTPSEGSVKVGQTLKLTIKTCKTVGVYLDGHDMRTVESCADVDKANTLSPSVNGHVFGNSAVGTIDRVVASPLSEFIYTAPAALPQPRQVAASVELLDPSFPGAQNTYLVSNITVLEDVRSCEWLRNAATLSVDVSYDPYAYSASDGVESYVGRTSGSLHGTLVNLMPLPNTTRYGAWLSATANLEGQASVSDSHQFGDGKTHFSWQGSGAARVGTPGSAVVLSVDFETCSYSVVARFWVEALETYSYDGLQTTKTVLRETATFGATGMPVSLPGKVFGEMQARALLDVADTPSGSAGFAPEGQSETLRATAEARVRWNIVAH